MQNELDRLHHLQVKALSYLDIILIHWLPAGFNCDLESLSLPSLLPNTDSHPKEVCSRAVTGGTAFPTASHTDRHKPVKPVPVSAADGDPSPGVPADLHYRLQLMRQGN